MLGRALGAVFLMAVAMSAADAGRRCVRRPDIEPLKLEKPTLAQLRAAITARTVTLGAEVTYALSYGGGDASEPCDRGLGATGAATTPLTRDLLAACMWAARGTAVTAKTTWKPATAKRLPAPLRPLAGDLSGFDKRHLIATAIVDSKRAKEGDHDAYALYVAHREGTTIVIDAVFATERIWTK